VIHVAFQFLVKPMRTMPMHGMAEYGGWLARAPSWQNDGEEATTKTGHRAKRGIEEGSASSKVKQGAPENFSFPRGMHGICLSVRGCPLSVFVRAWPCCSCSCLLLVANCRFTRRW
jgi:hypothetical protein